MEGFFRTKWFCLFLAFFSLFIFAKPTFAAISYDLITPQGQLARGQEITFTININTGGETVTAGQAGLTYDPTKLEYISSAPGAAMDSITVDNSYGSGKLVFNGVKTAGFNGAGVYATIVFKIIAAESGSTELCTLWVPEPTPSTPPTGIPPTAIPGTPIPTVPQPTALPQTGGEAPKNTGTLVGSIFIAAAIGAFFFSKKQTYASNSHKKKETHLHKK